VLCNNIEKKTATEPSHNGADDPIDGYIKKIAGKIE
jgi:hypothetical protein